jgi:hypothetical protein
VELPGGGLTERARHLVTEMVAARPRRYSGVDDDIRDPIGQPVEVHDEVGEAITEALLPVLARFAARLSAGRPRPPGPVGPVGRGEKSLTVGCGASQAS